VAGSGVRAGSGVDARGADPSTAVTRGGTGGTSKRPELAASITGRVSGFTRAGSGARGGSTRGASTATAAVVDEGARIDGAAGRAGAAESGRWLGSSHSPHHRHFTAAS